MEERVIVETGTDKVVEQRHGVKLPGEQEPRFAGFLDTKASWFESKFYNRKDPNHNRRAVSETDDPLMPLLDEEVLFWVKFRKKLILKTKTRRFCLFQLKSKYEALSLEEFARRCAEQDRPLLTIFSDTSRDIGARKRAMGKLVRNFSDKRKVDEGMLATFLLSNVDNAEALALLHKAVFAGETLNSAEVLQCVSPLVDESVAPAEHSRISNDSALPASPRGRSPT